MARLMGIATHHKAGTVWLKRVVKQMSRKLGIPWLGLWSARQMHKVPATGRAFLCNWHGTFPPELWARDDFTVMHIIRDPRDVLLSGVAYHLHAGPRGEKFLHAPRDDLGGLTYQQHLQRLGCFEDRLGFEMENRHAETVAEMLAWPWGHRSAHELRYETLMTDRDGRLFGSALDHLGLVGPARAIGIHAFLDNSLFAGLADPARRSARVEAHVTSGTPRRWLREMPRGFGRRYAARFGTALVRLGYETGTDWVDRLPDHGATP